MDRSDEHDNVVPFPSASSDFEDAGLWLARLDKGLADRERAALAAWLGENPQNGKALHEMAAFWGDVDLLSDLPLPVASHERQRRHLKTHVAGWGIAAAFVVVAFGMGMFAWFESPAMQAPVAIQFERSFETAVGERATEQLPDGSSITLNTNTAVHVIFHEHDRFVALQRGEAHFSVADDIARPFGVRAAGHIVRAVGTAFAVRIQAAGDVDVTVIEGVVQILDDRTAADTVDAAQALPEWWTNSIIARDLVQGEVALLDDAAADNARMPQILKLEPADLDNKLAWQNGGLIFEGETLETVLAEFGRYTTTTFEIGDADLAGLRVGGYFTAGDVEGLLVSLHENFAISAEHVADNHIRLLPTN